MVHGMQRFKEIAPSASHMCAWNGKAIALFARIA